MRRLLREPLLHFVLIGAGIFVLFGLFGRNEERPDRIVLTRGELDQLVSGWQRTWQRPPTEAELAGLVDGWIREQVYAREAIAMGLDQDDTIIRRRLRQKIEFLVDDLADAAPPHRRRARRVPLRESRALPGAGPGLLPARVRERRPARGRGATVSHSRRRCSGSSTCPGRRSRRSWR